MRKEPKEFANTIFRIIIEAHNRDSSAVKEKEQGESNQLFNVSSIVFTWLAGIEGDIHLDSLLNKSMIELSKLQSNTNMK